MYGKTGTEQESKSKNQRREVSKNVFSFLISQLIFFFIVFLSTDLLVTDELVKEPDYMTTENLITTTISLISRT